MLTRAVMDLLAKSLSSQASQSRNYEFCWQSMRAIGGGRPDEPLNSVIERDIGGMAKFHLAFAKTAVSKFGGASA